MKRVIVKLNTDGTIKVEAEGYTGSTCEQATAFLENLGIVGGEEKKSEYYDTQEQKEEVYLDG